MTRERIAGELSRLRRRRRRVYALCAAGMAAGFIAMAWAAARLVPIYGSWSQEHRTESRSIGVLSGPVYVIAEVRYENETPEGACLEYRSGERSWQPIYGASVAGDPELRIMSIAYDLPPDAPNTEYRLSLRPGSNRDIAYQVDLYPSYRYMSGEILTETCPDGKLWLSMSAEYAHCLDGNGAGISVQVHGEKYASTVYSGWLAPDGSKLSVCVTDLLNIVRSMPAGANELSVSLSASYEDPSSGETKYASISKTVTLDDPEDWPMVKRRYDPGTTDEYLARHMPPQPAENTNANTDEQKGGDADGSEN